MKQLRRIILENFQSHEYSELVLDPGMNVFIGNSDSGKTSIIRAVHWVLYNEPRGDYFIQHGKKFVKVSLEFLDKTFISKIKTKERSDYYLKLPSGEEYNFKGFETTVPSEIKEILQIEKVSLGKYKELNLNIADQLDGPFLMQEKDFIKASAIDKLIGVDVLDCAIKMAEKDIKINYSKLEINKEKLELLYLDKKQFSCLDREIEKIKKIKLLEKKIHQKINELHALILLFEKIKKYKEEKNILTTKQREKLKRLKNELEERMIQKDKFDTRLEVLEIQEQGIIKKLKSMNLTPDTLEKQITDLKNEIENLFKISFELLPKEI